MGSLEDMFEEDDIVDTEYRADQDTGEIALLDTIDLKLVEAGINEAQLDLLTGKVNLDEVKVREGAAGTHYAYLPINWYIDRLNKITGWNWELVIHSREKINNEVFMTGTLEINGGKIKIPCEGGHRIKNNPNNTLADAYKSARADMLKHACTWLGLGADLQRSKFKEQALVYHGKSTRPMNLLDNLKTHLEIRKTASTNDVIDALGSRGVVAEPWELQSKDRVVALIAAVKRSK